MGAAATMNSLDKNILDQYDYARDPVLQEHLAPYDRACLHDMMAYGRGINRFGLRFVAHQNRVAKDGANLLRALGYSDKAAHNFRAAMLFHDIGKMNAVYDPQIWTLPDRPTAEQKALQKKHAALGADMWADHASTIAELNAHPHFAVRYAVTKYHHERVDGTGPEKLNAEDLPVFVQVSCIVDAYDGDRIKRPHQPKRRTPSEALKRMAGIDDTQTKSEQKYIGAFDPDLLKRYTEMKQNEPDYS
jgi:HD-GYP domain-containing protein (c-di-GMP phosphodiesterase class II)